MNEEYPLAALKQVRRASRDAAEVALGRCQKAVQVVEGQLKHVGELRQAALLEVKGHKGRDPMSSQISGANVALRREYALAKEAEVGVLGGRAAELNEELAKCRGSLAQARSTLAEAIGELEILQKHHRAWKRERRKERETFEAEEAEEVAGVVWRKRNDEDQR